MVILCYLPLGLNQTFVLIVCYWTSKINSTLSTTSFIRYISNCWGSNCSTRKCDFPAACIVPLDNEKGKIGGLLALFVSSLELRFCVRNIFFCFSLNLRDGRFLLEHPMSTANYCLLSKKLLNILPTKFGNAEQRVLPWSFLYDTVYCRFYI